MSKQTEAQDIIVKVDLDKEFVVRLKGEQLKFLLALITANSYPGDKVFLVGDTIGALQTPLLDDAHGAVEDDGKET